MPRKAVIVAAGLSSRLYPLTIDTPKALLPIGDETMLSRSIRLLRSCGVSDIAVVVGYRAESIRRAVDRSVAIIPNPFYQHCNNMGSLMMSRAFCGDERFAYLHGDLVYTDRMLAEFITATRSSEDSVLDLLTAFGSVDDEAMKVRVDDRRFLVESNKAIPLIEAAGEWTGIAVVHRPSFVFDAVERHMMAVGTNDYDTAAFTSLAAAGSRVRCIPTNGDSWKEIDTADDLTDARALFGTAH